ncbi:MAG TPA: VTT domain-containing protein [Acidiferrobacterales bacterium]|nr:VTT domain-containing protein [Acidiferrobacterales bacterium]
MTTLIKLFLILASFFVSTFIVIKLAGVITVDDIRAWLEAARSVSPWIVGLVVAGLLFADLFIAVPNLTVCILSGYFLGFELGAFFCILGVSMAGITGHLLSRSMGRRLLEKIVRAPEKIKEMEDVFNRHGFVMILLSWALPILPEATACLSGFTRMSFWKFLSAWVLGAYPYVTIAAYAGSMSTLSDPKPAIYAAIGLSAFFWLTWVIFLRFRWYAVKTAQAGRR